MSRRIFATVLLVVCLQCVRAIVLPEYITPCKKDSPDLKECFVKNAKAALSYLADQADPILKVNTLNPVYIDIIDLQATPNLKVVLRECVFDGFDKMETLDASLTDNEIMFKSHGNKINLMSKYDVKGQILILPIQGDGDMNVTVLEADFTYTGKLSEVERNGEKYFNLESSSMHIVPEKIYWHLDNLFNGDKRLGDEMNKFLNEGWREVFEEVQGAMESSVCGMYDGYISIILNKIPKSQILQ